MIIKTTKKISHLDVNPGLVNDILNFSQWDEERNKYYGLGESSSILLKYNLNLAEGVIPKFNHQSAALFAQLTPVIERVISLVGPAYCSKAMITNLPAGKIIEDHVDPGWLFCLQRRFHWAIETNSKSVLRIGDDILHIEQGDIWEINNKSMHGASNQGETGRIHFIFDLMVLDEVVAQTPTPFESGSFDDRFFKIVLKRKLKTGKFIV